MSEVKKEEMPFMDFIDNEENHVEETLKDAYKDCAWAKEPDKIPEELISGVMETEVLIIGGGIAGMAAGARCTDLGLNCIVLEKYRGLVARGAHIACTDSKVMRELGVSIDKKQFARDWMHLCGSRVNEDLLWLYINNCSEAVQWLTELGGENVELRLFGGRYKGPDFTEYDGTHYLVARPGQTKYKNRHGSILMCEVLQDRCLEGEGNKIIRNTKALYLEKNAEGRVVSCVALNKEGKYIRYCGKQAVILATGDIGSNPDMLKTFCPMGLRPKRNGYAPVDPETKIGLNTGDGHRMAYWMGGQFETPSWALSLHLLAYSIYVFFFLFVNREGKRFMNEDSWVQAKSIRCLMQP
ncbi:MAG: FAD-binding protein, partial [Oscillospiraceae bacterium]|nr:FAD-binding protein [Oscillospiraceae bacterium]